MTIKLDDEAELAAAWQAVPNHAQIRGILPLYVAAGDAFSERDEARRLCTLRARRIAEPEERLASIVATATGRTETKESGR